MWKDITDYEDLYQISDEGVIKSLRKKKGMSITGVPFYKPDTILKQKTTQFGYKSVGLLKSGKRKWFFVHRLVIESYLGKRPSPSYQVNHKDGDKTNNHIKNLEWVTSSGNHLHAYRSGLRSMKGENHNNRKLDVEKVAQIRASKKRNCDLAREFNVSPSLIVMIKKGQVWT